MDKLTLINTRDFPWTTNSAAFMQAAYSMFEQFGFLGGDNVIVSGCEVTGSSVASGYMFLNGILMPFIGGTIQTNVKIVTVVTDVTVDAGIRQQTSYRAEFGTSANPAENIPWVDIVKLDGIKSLMAQLIINAALISNNSGRLDDIENDSGELAMTSTYPEVVFSTNQVQQIGREVIISLRFSLSSALTGGNIALMNLPVGIDKPITRKFFPSITATYGDNDVVDCQLFTLFQTDGTLRPVSVNNVLPNREYTINIKYFV